MRPHSQTQSTLHRARLALMAGMCGMTWRAHVDALRRGTSKQTLRTELNENRFAIADRPRRSAAKESMFRILGVLLVAPDRVESAAVRVQGTGRDQTPDQPLLARRLLRLHASSVIYHTSIVTLRMAMHGHCISTACSLHRSTVAQLFKGCQLYKRSCFKPKT